MTACEELDRWLDEGRPPGGAGSEAHAATCLRCAAALRAAQGLERALAAALEAQAPAGFADRVMAALPRPEAALARRRARRVSPWAWAVFGSLATLLGWGAWLAWPAHAAELPALGADGLDRAAAAGFSLPLAAQASLSLAFAMAATAGGWWLARVALLWTLRAATWRRPHPVR